MRAPWVLFWMAAFIGAPVQAVHSSPMATSLQPFVDRHELAGAVILVASKDRILDLESLGYADVAASKPMTGDSLFWIASMSKPIVATALMMLVDRGKVHLDDRVDKYLPRFTPRVMKINQDRTHVDLVQPEHGITIRQLLSHASGMAVDSPLDKPTADLLPLSLRVESYALQPLLFQPGTDAVYSNAGFNVVARIVEVVSGMRIEDFLQQSLFEPLGMKDTTFWPNATQVKRLAKSYGPDSTPAGLKETPIELLHYPLTDRAARYPMPAGGLFSTAGDMAKFCQMLLNGGTLAGHNYVSPTAIAEMTRNLGRAVIMTYDGYGLGWGTRAGGVFGTGSSYTASMTIDPTNGLIMIWMAQDAGGAGIAARLVFEKQAESTFNPK